MLGDSRQKEGSWENIFGLPMRCFYPNNFSIFLSAIMPLPISIFSNSFYMQHLGEVTSIELSFNAYSHSHTGHIDQIKQINRHCPVLQNHQKFDLSIMIQHSQNIKTL